MALKAWSLGLGLLSGAWFIACALLIALRRAGLPEARLLVLILLADTTPSFAFSALLFALPQICALVAMVLLLALSGYFGQPIRLRKVLEGFAYVAIALDVIRIGVFFTVS